MVFKKGLLVGINYVGTGSQLNGCINDTENLKELLKRGGYLSEDEMTFLNDNQTGNLYPTKSNIMNHLENMVKFANDHKDEKVLLFFSYSGHGYYVKDLNGDEPDGKDEVLCPVDYDKNGFIIDDDLKSQFIDRLGNNVTIVVLIDACHSGTVLDLRYNFDNLNNLNKNKKNSESSCDVVMISGCRDNQTSADAYINDQFDKRNEYQGAMTAAFIKNYKDGISYENLIKGMRKWLIKNKYDQVPQLSSGKKIDIRSPIILSTYNN